MTVVPVALERDDLLGQILGGSEAFFRDDLEPLQDFAVGIERESFVHEIHGIFEQPRGKPLEQIHVMAAIYSKQASETLLELKRTAESLAPGLRVLQGEPKSWEHPARCVELWWQGRVVGRLSELHPSLLDSGRAAVLDLDLALLLQCKPNRARYQPVRRFPTSAFDLSVIAPARELAANLELHIRQFAGELVEVIEYVREFQGAPLPEGCKSVTFRIVASAPDRTLSSVETTALYDRIVAGLTGLGYAFRA